MLQILFALLAGMLTVGAPCILPLLPILFGSSIGQENKSRPLFIALGFVVAFSFTGLFLSVIIQQFRLPPDFLRSTGVILLAFFGLMLLWQAPFNKLKTRLSGAVTSASQTAQKAGSGNWGGFVLGLILGIIWTPCAGPVLGSILSLIAIQSDLITAAILLLAYSLGASIPMLLIAYGGQYITTKVRWLSAYSETLQKIFGLIIITLAISMYLQWDLVIQAKLLEVFPSWNFAEIIKL